MPQLRTPAYLPPAVARYRLQNREAAPRVASPFWEFRNATGDTAELMIYAEIGFSWFDDGVTAADFAKELSAIKAKNLVLRINSPGGDVFDGLAIGNLLAEWPGSKTVKVDALAASIASVIAVKAGTPTRTQPDNKIIMGRQAQFMIHDASGFAMGNAADMREMADLLDMISDNIAAAYVDKAGGTAAGWRSIMKGERWYTDAESVSAGLADEVSGAEDADMMPCPGCDGSGKKGGKNCPECGGDGEVPADDCPECGGTGEVDGKKCQNCGGGGQVPGGGGKKTSNVVDEDDKVNCETCDGSGKIKRGSTKCPDCGGSGKVPADDLAAMIRRAYAPAAFLRPADYDHRGGQLPPALVDLDALARTLPENQPPAQGRAAPAPVADAPRRYTTDDGVKVDLDGGLGDDEPELDWTAGLAASLKAGVYAAVEPAAVDVDTFRDLFAGIRVNAPAPAPVAPRPVDLGPKPAPVVEPPRNELADAIRLGIGVGSINQPESRPVDSAPVDLGEPPARPEPEPEAPRNVLADLIGAAVDVAAKDQPEPAASPVEPEHVDDNPPFRLDVKDLRRAVKESRF